MNKAVRYFALVALLAGCAMSRPVALPNGSIGYSIDCSGAALDMTYCMNRASQVCRGPYRVIDQATTGAGATAAQIGGNVFLVPVIHRVMIVTCGA